MKQISCLVFLLGIITLILSWDKPHSSIIQSNSPSAATAIFSTSLRDSLDEKTFLDLKIENIIGVKIVNLQGLDARYFEYKADAGNLLSALTNSPFELQAEISDTTCRRINYNDLQKVLITIDERERPYFEEMLKTDPLQFELYECVKSPVLHHVAINRSSGKVFHRIVQLI